MVGSTALARTCSARSVAVKGGSDGEPAELADVGDAAVGLAAVHLRVEYHAEVVAGGWAFGEPVPVEGDGELVAVRVDPPSDGGLRRVGAGGEVLDAFLGFPDSPAQAVVAAVVGAFESFQSGDFGLGLGLVQE